MFKILRYIMKEKGRKTEDGTNKINELGDKAS